MTIPNEISYSFITSGSTYLDIDAYACCVALAELLQLQGQNAVAYSAAPCNYSVCASLVHEGEIVPVLPSDDIACQANYIIVDVSDPNYIQDTVPLDNIIAVYDHHAGFESYWQNRIGEDAHIEFIGAAATLLYREWQKAGMLAQMSRSTALLLIAAILDNTLYLTSSNTTQEDIQVFNELCERENVDDKWCAAYFSEVQQNIEADLKNALFGDMKTLQDNPVLPSQVAQLCVWDANRILDRIGELREWFAEYSGNWMVNLIALQHRCSYFLCDDAVYQKELERLFAVHFDSGVAKTEIPYLRKEIIKKSLQL